MPPDLREHRGWEVVPASPARQVYAWKRIKRWSDARVCGVPAPLRIPHRLTRETGRSAGTSEGEAVYAEHLVDLQEDVDFRFGQIINLGFRDVAARPDGVHL